MKVGSEREQRRPGHLDFNRPFPIRQVRKRIEALGICDGDKLFAALSGRCRRSGRRQAAECDLSAVLRSRCQVGGQQPRHGAEDAEAVVMRCGMVAATRTSFSVFSVPQKIQHRAHGDSQ